MKKNTNDILDCVEKLSLLIEGDLKVGDHESLSAFGNKEQQQLSEISQDITQLFLTQSKEIELTMGILLEKMNDIGIPQYNGKKGFFKIKKGKLPKSIILGQYKDVTIYIEKLGEELVLQKIQLLRETHLLARLEKQLQSCEQELLMCIEKGQGLLKTKSEVNETDDWWYRLEQKINDIKVSKIVAKQSLVQVQLLSENNKEIMNRINVLRETVIPAWKKQMELFLSVINKSDKNIPCQLLKEEIQLLSKIEMVDVTIRKKLERISL